MSDILPLYAETIRRSPLFVSLEDKQLAYAIQWFHGVQRHYDKGEYLHRAGESFPVFGLVLSGRVQVCTTDFTGEKMIMNTVEAGGTFAESLSFLKQKNTPIYIQALDDSLILWLSTEPVSASGNDPFDVMMRNRFITLLASRTLRMNDRIQILSKLTLRDKLNTFFSNQIRQHNGSRTFSIPLSREDMAVYLGTNRSALSRELSAMKNEGLIDFYRNSFRIL